jgi:hypothetical protein
MFIIMHLFNYLEIIIKTIKKNKVKLINHH